MRINQRIVIFNQFGVKGSELIFIMKCVNNMIFKGVMNFYDLSNFMVKEIIQKL